MNIAICDDNEYTLSILEKYIEYGFKKYTDDFKIRCFNNGILLLNEHKLSSFDVLFLDIDMPKISGFDIAKQLRNNFSRCFIIFITSHSNLVYKSFDFQPFNFIKKNPPEYMGNSIIEVVGKLMEHMKQNKKIILENDNETVAIYYHNIIFIESDKHYLKYYLQNREEPIYIRGSIKEKEIEIENYDFVRIHRRYIVNLKYIKFVDTKIGKVYINFNGLKKSLSMGKSYEEQVEIIHTNYLRDML